MDASPSRTAVIVNPISGAAGRPGAGRRRADLARAVLAAERLDGEVRVTEGPGHAFDLAREAVARSIELVVAWGGDGTVNEVGRALAFGTAALAIVPAGSGNGLARDLGVSRDPATALRSALRGAERRIDAGELGGRLFFNTAGIGFDAQVAARFNAREQGRRGLLPYLTLALRELVAYRAAEYALAVDGERLGCRALVIACANAREYGGHARIAPRARLDDGRLDLVIVAPRGLLATLWQARRLFTGTIAQAPGVLVRQFTHLEVAAPTPLAFHVDGEPAAGGHMLAARVHPGALRVRIGRRRPGAS